MTKIMYHAGGTHTQTIPAFTPQPQAIIALWLVLTVPTHKGMARLS